MSFIWLIILVCFFVWNRFVRFVSSPEVLERFVTIEREIVQIENSIQSSESIEADGMLRDRSLVTILWISSWPVYQVNSYYRTFYLNVKVNFSQTLNFIEVWFWLMPLVFCIFTKYKEAYLMLGIFSNKIYWRRHPIQILEEFLVSFVIFWIYQKWFFFFPFFCVFLGIF